MASFAMDKDQILVGVLLYISGVIVYRLFLHPLSRFPGPKLAAISSLPEFYHDVLRGGRYIWEIERMHEKYGPIVRINPRQLHIKDPCFYDEIYAGGSRRRDKYAEYVNALAADNSSATTVDHTHHRIRRGFISPYFSKRSVLQFEATISEKLAMLTARLEEASHAGSVLNLQHVFAALTADIIMQYAYGETHGYLAHESFRNDLVDAVATQLDLLHVNRFFPGLVRLFKDAPPWLLRAVGLKIADVVEVKLWIRELAAKALARKGRAGGRARETIFDALTAETVPPEEKTLDRLEVESTVIFAAGTDTTARALAVASFHLMQNQDVLRTLREELKRVMPTPTTSVSWLQLEQLPYLSGVVNESLRLSYALVTRLPRVAPDETLKYGDYMIPPGTPISQSAYFVHQDPTIFPEPQRFHPERWIRAAEKGENLKRFLVSFNKGSRQCLGINLAYAELYRTIAAVARRFDMELYETTLEDILVNRDLGFGQPETGRFQVQARVTGIVKE
ncbi:cytochrome P450 [Aspergillus clavatus NRRL 1]|uniref:Benzoate 4-monooxygenase cytochrome P450 n=1 Tax=Aspergillus clavatus (strain ATCC 1007 / CBS 513.65 / DSM 816 / NCTC 3887 / NRRL 1 / QM 1276 / 107) TaxID=344612 RepID=A1CAY4_ASPCL|nr:benzoate 4-monooxygenase cytochrome P450 [Aspergillus clavatus NRRL 1]EAW12902.1 benzoate 4-monooxygenase cytochrome P450 [Aspergillus clavatus NRRL 1]